MPFFLSNFELHHGPCDRQEMLPFAAASKQASTASSIRTSSSTSNRVEFREYSGDGRALRLPLIIIITFIYLHDIHPPALTTNNTKLVTRVGRECRGSTTVRSIFKRICGESTNGGPLRQTRQRRRPLRRRARFFSFFALREREGERDREMIENPPT